MSVSGIGGNISKHQKERLNEEFKERFLNPSNDSEFLGDRAEEKSDFVMQGLVDAIFRGETGSMMG